MQFVLKKHGKIKGKSFLFGIFFKKLLTNENINDIMRLINRMGGNHNEKIKPYFNGDFDDDF